jgi:hypothetical protein
VPSFAKLTTYKIPARSTAGPSIPFVKPFKAVNEEDLNKGVFASCALVNRTEQINIRVRLNGFIWDMFSNMSIVIDIIMKVNNMNKFKGNFL